MKAVILVGGDQNLGEELEHPWLHEEYDFLRRWAGDGTPLLGICLGAQTLAHALGADVGPIGTTLCGFYESALTSAGTDDPVLGVLPQRFDAFNVNGFTFDVPEGAVTLATGPVPQAFRADGRACVYLVERTHRTVARWASARPAPSDSETRGRGSYGQL